MITESATIVSVDTDRLRVETIQQSTCGACAAQKGCGQGVLAKYLTNSTYFDVDIDPQERESYVVGDLVHLGIDEMAMVRASLWLYCLPLGFLIAGAYVGSLASDSASIVGGILGLAIGGLASRYHALSVKNDPKYAPVLLSENAAHPVRLAQ